MIKVTTAARRPDVVNKPIMILIIASFNMIYPVVFAMTAFQVAMRIDSDPNATNCAISHFFLIKSISFISFVFMFMLK